MLFNLGERCGIERECFLTIRRLPEQSDWNRYTVAPPKIEVRSIIASLQTKVQENDEKLEHYDTEEEEEQIETGDDEEDSFVVGDDEGISEAGSEDEIDLAEKALEEEDEREHRRWQVRCLRANSLAFVATPMSFN